MSDDRRRPADRLPQARPVAGEAGGDGPPPFGSWTLLYAVVVIELIGVILVCHWITLHNA